MFQRVLKEALDALPEGWLTLQLGAQTAGHAPWTRRKTIKKLPGGVLVTELLLLKLNITSFPV